MMVCKVLHRAKIGEKERWLEESDTAQKLRKALQTLEASFEYPVDIDISHGVNQFIEKHHADLLVMMPHKHELMERLFWKSETKDMIFHSHIPLLILPETLSERKVAKKKIFKEKLGMQKLNRKLSYAGKLL